MRDGAAVAARPRVSPVAAKERFLPVWMMQLMFVAAHAPLAVALPRHSRLVTLHAVLVFGVGLLAAVRRRPHLVACTVAYITGAAVFWRMKTAPYLPWEFGKYAIITVLAAALVFSVHIRRPVLPIAYAALLLPSAMLTVTSVPWVDARDMLSFNLSGPITLAVTVLFFSSIRVSPAQLRWVATSLLAPIVATAVVAAYGLQKALEDPEFEFYGGASNFETSGHFGPNQVSAILALGILAIVLYLILGTKNRISAGAMILLILFLTRQMLVTLSRGGTYMAVAGAAAASIYLIQERGSRKRLLIAVACVVAALLLVVIPRLEALTGGVLSSRFENTSSTGRDLLIKGDLDSWAENPVLGVGPGLGGANRLKYFYITTAHTEYTRMVGEHGLLGLIALVLLVAMALRSLRAQTTRRGKAISAAFLTYAFLFMLVDATRLPAPALTFGLAGVTIVVPRRKGSSTGQPDRFRESANSNAR